MSGNRFAELVVWKLPSPLPACKHPFKYRLAFVVDEACVLRFDNETGKGDHKHVGAREVPYVFTGLEQLMRDFWREIDRWRPV
ncbi:MAG TPA: DUF6516 family protein [Stellaceae bacterium]|nr:DUF6516 family protein [Stellaceae bacterium]